MRKCYMEVIKPINTRKEKPIYGVYKIENLLDGKVYVGKSKDIGRRWYEHKYELNKGKHINKHLQNSWYMEKIVLDLRY